MSPRATRRSVGEARRIVVRLLRQPAVIGPGVAEDFLEDLVGGVVGGADRRAALVLPPDFRRLAEMGHRHLAGLTGRLGDQGEIRLPVEARLGGARLLFIRVR